MTTLQENIKLVKAVENVLGFDKIEILAFHYNNGCLVGCAAIADGFISQFYHEDFETLIESYKQEK